jgi:hypothetical protein
MCSQLESLFCDACKEVVQSTIDAEYITVCDACKEVVWLKALYAELYGDSSYIDLFCDSQSVIYLTKTKNVS